MINLFRNRYMKNKAPGDDHGENGNSSGTKRLEAANRITWNREVESLLTQIGNNVGYGNFWRFPILCMRNGGGAFLIPYFFFLIVCGIPLFYLELAISQFSSRSAICVWGAVPLFKGLGWSMIASTAIINIYYNVIIAWALFYLLMSFTSELPWSNCNNSWNTPGCITSTNQSTDTAINLTTSKTLMNTTSTHRPDIRSTYLAETTNDTTLIQLWKKLTPAEEFWQFKTLQLSDGIGNLGGIRWELLLCLLAAWVIVFLCLCKGIKSSGKVIYFTATAPYVFLTILLGRVLFLPGALDGIKYYIIPDFNRLTHFKVWAEACLQIFYTLGPCWGGLVTVASYNKFHHNFLRDTIISSFTCCGTSFYAGFVIFATVGFMAREADADISEVLTSGPGLLFMAYPDALTRLPIAPMWSILFFLMVVLIGLDSLFVQVETVVTGIVDRFPKYLQHRKMAFTATLCLVKFLLGIPLVTHGGMYLFQIIDWYAAAFSFIIVGFLETMALCYIYGLKRLEQDIRMMLGHGVSIYWKICWTVITPMCLFSIIIFTIFVWQPPVYGDFHYPDWAIAMGWLMAMYSIVPIPLLAILEIIKEKGPVLQRIKNLLRPAGDWGPARMENRVGSNYYTQSQQDISQDILLQTI